MADRTELSVDSPLKNRLRMVWVILGVLVLAAGTPRLAGGTYSVLGIPFYNLVCLSPTASSFFSALVSTPPTGEDYYLFLSNRGCNNQDVDRRNLPTEEQVDDVSPQPPDDPISDLFANLGQIAQRSFEKGMNDTARFLIPFLQRNVLAKAAYFIGYIALVSALAALLNLVLQSEFRKRAKPAA